MLRRWFGSEARVFEWICAAYNIGWGLWLCNPAIDFGRPSYLVLAAVAPQWVWGSIIAALGIMQAIAIGRENRNWRRNVALTQSGVWLVVALALGLYNVYSTALMSYFWIATLHIAIWIRLAAIQAK